MEPFDPTILAWAASIAAFVGIVKTFLPATTPTWVSPLIVAVASAGVVAAGLAGGELTGTPLEVASTWVTLALTAIGARETGQVTGLNAGVRSATGR